jgi:hypothetical protein
VSIRLLWAWLLKQSIVHTAVDDLESFIWLLSWALVLIVKKYGSEDPVILHKVLSSKDLAKNVKSGYRDLHLARCGVWKPHTRLAKDTRVRSP